MKKSDFSPSITYSSLLPSTKTKELLYEFCTKIGIPNLVDPETYHCTLLYSRTPCFDKIQHVDFRLPCSSIMKKFKVLGDEGKTLVIELYCPHAERLHDSFIKKYGATHDYEKYIPHITVSENFTGEIPTAISDMEIRFTDHSVEELT